MINVIVPIIEEVEAFEDFVNKNAKRGVKFFVGIKENLAQKFKPKSKTIKILKFSDKSKREEILNSLQEQEKSKGKILIVRRPLTEQEFFNLTTSQKDVAVLKRKRNRFVSAFKRMISAIIKKVFAFSYFDDISAVFFNENMFELISVCSNLSMASRINKFVGVEIEEFEAERKSVNKERNKIKNALKFSLYTLFLVASVVGVVMISIFTPIKTVVVLFEILWLIVALTLWIVAILNYSRAIIVGDLRFDRAKEVVETQESG